mmetsp:Transcript_30975/g.82300  ORF Transcript_30975/g.82300 Transcript_30975/m.82300 type:complete len:116 (-) Transcript_30975:107-454(-)
MHFSVHWAPAELTLLMPGSGHVFQSRACCWKDTPSSRTKRRSIRFRSDVGTSWELWCTRIMESTNAPAAEWLCKESVVQANIRRGEGSLECEIVTCPTVSARASLRTRAMQWDGS